MTTQFNNFIRSRRPHSEQLFNHVKEYLNISPERLSDFEEMFHSASTPYRDHQLEKILSTSSWSGPGLVLEACNRRGFLSNLVMPSYMEKFNILDEQAPYIDLCCHLTSDDKNSFLSSGIMHSNSAIYFPNSYEGCKGGALAIMSIPYPARNCVTSVAYRTSYQTIEEYIGAIRKGEILPTADLDIEVAPIVRCLNLCGIPTSMSCGGHGFEAPNVGLHGESLDEFLKKYKSEVLLCGLSFSENSVLSIKDPTNFFDAAEGLYKLARCIWEKNKSKFEHLPFPI